MKNTQVFFVLLIVAILSACSEPATHYKFWNTSKFQLDSTVLRDNDEIKLIYTSGSPDNNEDLSYYVQVVAISQKSGDTFNILTPLDNGFSKEDGDKVYNFISENNIIYKLMQRDVQHIPHSGDLGDISKIKSKRIDRVVRDPKFDEIADNKYLTVIGMVGTSNPPPGN